VINDVFWNGLVLIRRAYFRRWSRGILGFDSLTGTGNEDSIEGCPSISYGCTFYDRRFRTINKN
jgi:hypothetical protein